jgi:unsaturated rhamnogalacturonyl hydrolase
MRNAVRNTTLVLAACALATGCKHAAPEVKPAAPPVAAAAPGDAKVKDVIARVARHKLRPVQDGEYPTVDSLTDAAAARAPEGVAWSYPWGVTLYGMLRSTDVTGDKDVHRFVLEHDRVAARYYAWLSGVREKFAEAPELKDFLQKSKVRGLMSLGSLDSCGAMGTQLIEAMLRHPDQVLPEHKQVAERIADWIVNKQDRLPDGTLWRSRSMGGTVWIDDLYMGGVFLTRWYKYTGDRKYLDDAARQVINMAARLQDTDGLWYHGYFEEKKERSPIKWGRANGWALVATVETLSVMPEDHPDRAKLLDILRRHVEGLKRVQAPSGMWRQVLDNESLWDETSCTAMFTYSIARAVNRGWIDASNMTVARKGFDGIAAQVTEDGTVKNTCQGTNIDMTLQYYIDRPRPDDDLHGPGVVLLAGTEILAGSAKTRSASTN